MRNFSFIILFFVSKNNDEGWKKTSNVWQKEQQGGHIGCDYSGGKRESCDSWWTESVESMCCLCWQAGVPHLRRRIEKSPSHWRKEAYQPRRKAELGANPRMWIRVSLERRAGTEAWYGVGIDVRARTAAWGGPPSVVCDLADVCLPVLREQQCYYCGLCVWDPVRFRSIFYFLCYWFSFNMTRSFLVGSLLVFLRFTFKTTARFFENMTKKSLSFVPLTVKAHE